jgi:apolipoprotein N-acyltransferase
MTTITQTRTGSYSLETSEALRLTIGIILSLLSGLFFFITFPPLNWWPFAWVALVPYLVAQHRFIPLRYSALAPTIAITVWLWPFLARLFNIPGAPIWFVNLGLIFGLIGLVLHAERKFDELSGYRWFIVQGVLAWVGFEMVRSFIPFMGTMGFIANPLAGQAWLIQPVSIFSIYGLNLLIILVNFSLAQVLILLIDRRLKITDTKPVDPRSTWRWAGAIAAAVVVWVALSLVILNSKPQGTQTVRVAALQPGLPEAAHVDPLTSQEQRLSIFTEQARQAAAQGAQIIFTSEMMFGFDPQLAHTDELRALAAETNAYLYLNYVFHDEAGFHNETVLLSPAGLFSEVYGKLHNTIGEPPIVSAGTFPVIDTPFGRIGSIICMDGVFTDAARNLARRGAQLIGNPSLNTTPGIGEQNWTHFVFRSVENQVPMVNADTAYASVITDAHGRILQKSSTPDTGREVLVADVTVGSGNSPHRILGDWLGWVALVGWVGTWVLESFYKRRAKKAVQGLP